MTRHISACLLGGLVLCGTAAAQQARFDDVIRNLRNPDAKIRVSAVRLLRESRYPEAAAPMAPLVTDPVDLVQLEAIAAERSFFLLDDVPAKKRVALFVEVRQPALAEAAFELGPLARRPGPVPPELVRALLQAVNDENQKVRVEAIYTLGTIARPPLSTEAGDALIKALDHYDPVIRTAAARVAGRLALRAAGDALLTAVNDSKSEVRFAAMRALGAIDDARAVQALTEQLSFYAKGEGAWSALDALSKIASPASAPLFRARLTDRDPFLRRAAAEGLGRAGDAADTAALQIGAGNDPSTEVRAAMAFALQKLGHNYIPRLVEFLTSPKMGPQIFDYFVELGPDAAPVLVPHLQDPSPVIRANVARLVGALGAPGATAALQPLANDKDPDVAKAAARALERLKASTP